MENENINHTHTSDKNERTETSVNHDSNQKAQELEQVMNNGMQFLAGMFKMSTGKDMGMEGHSIVVDKDTGEVTMKFKIPI